MNDLHRSALVADAHVDTLGYLHFEGGSLAEPRPGQQVDLARLKQAGMGLLVTALCPHWGPIAPGLRRSWAGSVFAMLDVLDRELGAHPELQLVTGRAALRRLVAQRSGGGQQIGLVLGIEGGEALEGDLVLLRTFHRLGVRLLTLTHNVRNELADGILEEGTGGGLSRFGRAVVEEMNRLGMVIDVSHLSPAGFWQVLEASSAPVIASHSNAKALCRHPRNLADDQLLALAAKGGVVGVNFVPLFLKDDPGGGQPTAGLEDVLDHLDYLVDLIGPAHVAIGSDFDGSGGTSPAGLEDVSRMPALTEGLLRRGHPEEVIRGILGENLLRVLEAVLPG